VDQAVAAQVLAAVAPTGLEAAETAWRDQERVGREKLRALELGVEKARYKTERARRQYDRVEPENRLVAGELEGRWEEALRQQTEFEERLHEAASAVDELDETERDRLFELGGDLDALWHHPEASAALKKRILRTVIEEIVADIADTPPRVVLAIHWAGGVHTRLEVAKNAPGRHRRCTDRKLVELIAELVKVCDDQAIASILNRLGYRTGAGNNWKESRVRSLRSTHGIPAFDRRGDRPWLTLQAASAVLDVSSHSVRKLIDQGILPAQQVVPHAPWVIERSGLELPGVKAAVTAIKKGRPVPSSDPNQAELPLLSTM
jgi:hypothetical protein